MTNEQISDAFKNQSVKALINNAINLGGPAVFGRSLPKPFADTSPLIRAAEHVVRKAMVQFDGIPVDKWPDLAHAIVLLQAEVDRLKPDPVGPEVA